MTGRKVSIDTDHSVSQFNSQRLAVPPLCQGTRVCEGDQDKPLSAAGLRHDCGRRPFPKSPFIMGGVFTITKWVVYDIVLPCFTHISCFCISKKVPIILYITCNIYWSSHLLIPCRTSSSMSGSSRLPGFDSHPSAATPTAWCFAFAWSPLRPAPAAP